MGTIDSWIVGLLRAVRDAVIHETVQTVDRALPKFFERAMGRGNNDFSFYSVIQYIFI